MVLLNPKEPRISVRVDPQLKARIEAVTAKTGIDEADLVRNCIEAICAHVEKTGSITFPVRIERGDCPRLPDRLEFNEKPVRRRTP